MSGYSNKRDANGIKKRRVLSKKVFTNYLLQSKDGKDLCILKFRMYRNHLKNGYIEEVVGEKRPPYEKIFRFTIDIKTDKSGNLNLIQERCVVCGKNKDVTLHHIVPKRIYKHVRKLNNDVPFSDYSHAFLCDEHHDEIESVIKEYLKGDITFINRMSQFEFERTREYRFVSMHKMYNSIVRGTGLTEEKKEALDNKFPEWRELEGEINRVSLEEARCYYGRYLPNVFKEIEDKHYGIVSEKLIDIHGSPDKVYEYFLQFLLDMNPTENIDYLKLNRN